MRPRAPFSKSISALTKSSDGAGKICDAVRRDPHRPAGERHEHVAEVNAERGPGAGWRVARIAAPIRRIDFTKIVVADIGVHVQHAAKRPAFEQAAHLLHRRLVSPFMADAEHAAGLGAGGEDTLGAGAGQRERLFAEHLLAGGKGRHRHLLVQQMGCHHRDGVKVGPL